MTIVQNYIFYRCTFCGLWFYSKKPLKSKKCWKCNRTFQFNKAFKFSKKCSTNQAILITKELKKRAEKESIAKYINQKNNLSLI